MQTFYAHTWTGKRTDWPEFRLGWSIDAFVFIGHMDNACAYGVYVNWFGHTFSYWVRTKQQIWAKR